MILKNDDFKVIIGKDVPETDSPIRATEEDKNLLIYNISEAIRDGGYDPISQLSGFIVSNDPTHISNHRNARTLIRVYLEKLRTEYGKDDGND